MSQRYVKIHAGSYRGQEVTEQTFPLITPMKDGANGAFITVNGAEVFGLERSKIRIKVAGPRAFTLVGECSTEDNKVEAAVVPTVVESDEEAMARIAEKFDILTEMTTAAIAGQVRAMIVTGPPGVGKSFNVETEIDKAELFSKIAGKKTKSTVVKGSATALGLYCTL